MAEEEKEKAEPCRCGQSVLRAILLLDLLEAETRSERAEPILSNKASQDKLMEQVGADCRIDMAKAKSYLEYLYDFAENKGWDEARDAVQGIREEITDGLLHKCS